MRNAADGHHHLLLLAITSQPPRPDQRVIEIPDTERRRAGLIRYPGAWIVTSEFNYDIAERSFYYDPNGPALGSFSPNFMKRVASEFRATLAQRGRRVNRLG